MRAIPVQISRCNPALRRHNGDGVSEHGYLPYRYCSVVKPAGGDPGGGHNDTIIVQGNLNVRSDVPRPMHQSVCNSFAECLKEFDRFGRAPSLRYAHNGSSVQNATTTLSACSIADTFVAASRSKITSSVSPKRTQSMPGKSFLSAKIAAALV